MHQGCCWCVARKWLYFHRKVNENDGIDAIPPMQVMWAFSPKGAILLVGYVLNGIVVLGYCALFGIG